MGDQSQYPGSFFHGEVLHGPHHLGVLRGHLGLQAGATANGKPEVSFLLGVGPHLTFCTKPGQKHEQVMRWSPASSLWMGGDSPTDGIKFVSAWCVFRTSDILRKRAKLVIPDTRR